MTKISGRTENFLAHYQKLESFFFWVFTPKIYLINTNSAKIFFLLVGQPGQPGWTPWTPTLWGGGCPASTFPSRLSRPPFLGGMKRIDRKFNFGQSMCCSSGMFFSWIFCFLVSPISFIFLEPISPSHFPGIRKKVRSPHENSVWFNPFCFGFDCLSRLLFSRVKKLPIPDVNYGGLGLKSG